VTPGVSRKDAKFAKGDLARVDFNTKTEGGRSRGGRGLRPRKDTDDHGNGEGMIGGFARGGFTTKDTEGTKRKAKD
jgi:hypothetical protein